jgi:hypothetical protein
MEPKVRYYINPSGLQAWRVDSEQIRYVRAQPEVAGSVFQNLTYQVDPFDQENENYLRSIFKPCTQKEYNEVFTVFLVAMRDKIDAFQKYFNVTI